MVFKAGWNQFQASTIQVAIAAGTAKGTFGRFDARASAGWLAARRSRRYLWLSVVMFLAACMNLPSPAERQALADGLAAAHGWQASLLHARPFDLVAYLPAQPLPAAALTILTLLNATKFVSIVSPRCARSARADLKLP